MSTSELQHCFDSELPLGVKELLTYARQLLEFCSYKALHTLSKNSDFLNDKEFRRLTFDMMLAWEAPSVHTLPVQSLLFSFRSSSFHLHHHHNHCRKPPLQVKRKPPGMRMIPPCFIQVPQIWRFRFTNNSIQSHYHKIEKRKKKKKLCTNNVKRLYTINQSQIVM